MGFSGTLNSLRRARAVTGRSLADLVTEILRLRAGPGRLGVSEYFDYRLYLDDLTADEKREFCGYRAQAVLEDILVDTYSKFLSLDKLTFHHLMRGYGYPTPTVHAVYSSAPRTWTGATLHGPAELAGFLASRTDWPMYVKPCYGGFGRGNTSIAGRSGTSLVLGNGSTVELDEFCKSIQDPSGLGWMVQEALQPHPSIARVCGERVSGIRVHPFIGRSGVAIHRVLWKINVGTHDSDNFVHGTSGNMLADIDVDTGRVRRVIAGVGFEQREVQAHPISGEPLIGFELPWFHDAIDLVRRAASAFPGFLCQGWDVALCGRGPVLLEVNWFGDVDLPQQSLRRGFLDASLRTLMRQRGIEPFLFGKGRPTYRNDKGRLGWRGSHWPY